MYKYLLLGLCSLELSAMQPDEIVLYVTPNSRGSSPVPRNYGVDMTDVKHWVIGELETRDYKMKQENKILSDRLDAHVKDTDSSTSKTRAALIATVVTTLVTTFGGVTATLVTYFTTRGYGSN